MAKPKIALQLYSVREDCAKDLRGTLKAVAEMGYEGVELAGDYGYSVEEWRKLLDEFGLKVAGAHLGIDTLLGDNFAKTVEFQRTIGNINLVVPSLPQEMTCCKEAWLETAKLFSEIAQKAKAEGMRLGYHNHMIEFQPINGEIPWDIFFQNTSPDVFMQLDTGNAMHGGISAEEVLNIMKRYPGRQITVHLKEYSATNDKAIIGEGDMKWKEFLTLCETTGNTEWLIIEQESYAHPPLECARLCFLNLKKIMEEMEERERKSPKGDKVKVGIIGVGQIGKHHIENYKKIEGVEIVAVADINEEEAKRVASLYGIPYVYKNFRDLLKHEEIEAVDVCLHNNFHMPVTVEALKAGKNVYCEKPMAGSYHDALLMYETAKATGKMLSIQISTIFSREAKAAKQIIKAGLVGDIYHARSVGMRRRGRPFVDGYGSPSFVQKSQARGGALYDTGVYQICRLLFLMGNPQPLRISGKIYQELPMDEKRREISKYDVEEFAAGFVNMENDISMDIIEAWAVNYSPSEGSAVFGNLGGIRLEPFAFFTNLADLEMDITVNLDSAVWRWHTVSYPDVADAYDSPQQHWVAALQGRVPLLPTAEIALTSMLISEGIYLSSQLQRELTAEEVKKMSQSTALPV